MKYLLLSLALLGLALSQEGLTAPTNEITSSKALLYDYGKAANPIRSGLTTPIPYARYSPDLHETGPTGIISLDLSDELGIAASPATSPGLAAQYIRIVAGEELKAEASATSNLFYVLSGEGKCSWGEDTTIQFGGGDLFVLPAGGVPLLEARSTSVVYWVHDAPLLSYLGAKPTEPRFEPTHYKEEWLKAELLALAAKPESKESNRVSLLLANKDLPQTRTVTHVLWAMFGIVPPGMVQAPHRHQSVALDLIITCQPGAYTLVGTELNADGSIKNPSKIEWEAGGAFVTPPGHWHSHVNESDEPAFLLPIQDAGLQTYLRTLDIRFSKLK